MLNPVVIPLPLALASIPLLVVALTALNKWMARVDAQFAAPAPRHRPRIDDSTQVIIPPTPTHVRDLTEAEARSIAWELEDAAFEAEARAAAEEESVRWIDALDPRMPLPEVERYLEDLEATLIRTHPHLEAVA